MIALRLSMRELFMVGVCNLNQENSYLGLFSTITSLHLLCCCFILNINLLFLYELKTEIERETSIFLKY